jgi:hypothetical protein
LTVKLICPISSPFPQDATDPGERLIDARRDFFELRAVGLTTGPSDPVGSFELSHRPFEAFNRYFKLAHGGES